MLIVKTSLKEIPGKGISLIAAQTIARGETVWTSDPLFHKKITLEEFAALPELQQEFLRTYATLMNDAYYYLDLDDTRFVNHSFDPNIEFTKDNIAVCLRDIAIGEEIVCDYTKLSPANNAIDFSVYI